MPELPHTNTYNGLHELVFPIPRRVLPNLVLTPLAVLPINQEGNSELTDVTELQQSIDYSALMSAGNHVRKACDPLLSAQIRSYNETTGGMIPHPTIQTFSTFQPDAMKATNHDNSGKGVKSTRHLFARAASFKLAKTP